MRLKENLRGTGKVFRFTFEQTFKEKANRITLLVTVILALALVPVLTLIKGGSSGQPDTPAPVTEENPYVKEAKERLTGMGLSERQAEQLMKEEVHYRIGDQTDRDEPESLEETGFWGQYAYSILIMTLCIRAVGYIIRAVVEEKSSKLVDTLLVSVEPMALLLGKILASLAYVLAVLALCGGAGYAGARVMGLFMDTSAATGTITGMFNADVTAAGIAVCVVSGVIGCLAFSVFAGLSGAGCSTMEESGGAMSGSMLLIMAGYMVSCMVPAFGTEGIALKVISVIPVVSMFVAPLQYMAGNLSFALVALSWLLEFICLAAVLLLAARVYRSLILYNGKRLTFKDILKAAGKERA